MKYKLSLIGLVGFVLTANSEDIQTGKINVYSPGPLPSIGIDQKIISGSVQTISPKNLEDQQSINLADYLNNNTQGISFNEVGGNPWQPEIFYRGYSAGSIAGNPQGLSIYVDGVRENQPFSDVVLWDTIPTWALSGTQVVGGSNPIYGLNTLGGAIAMQTKNGKLFNKGRVSQTLGSWDRRSTLVEYGGVLEESNVDYYFGYNHTNEEGWRDYSPSHLNQLFAKVGKDFENSRIEASYTAASNNLIGNGLAPEYLLGGDNAGVNTIPDLTENRYQKLNIAYTEYLSDTTMFAANAYWKQSNRYTLNGDAEIEFDEDNLVLTGATISGKKILRYSNDEIEQIEGETRTTKTKQDAYGINAQLTFTEDLFGYKNHLVTGANFETSLISFVQNEYEGSNILSGRVIDAKSGTFENNTDLQGRTYTAGLYAVDTLSFNEQWHVTGGLRYNYQEVDNKDRRADQSAGSLTEKQSWARINPTIGVTYAPSDRYQTYASYSESNRAPTSIELGCSNPLIACQLPTQMADDPPLDDVVAKTYEVGARGQLTENLSWNSAIYHAMNHDDLMFINTNALNGLGYFDNVGRTQREGLDIGLNGSLMNFFESPIANKFTFATSYSYVNATYDSDFQLASDANSSRQISTTSYSNFDDPEAGVVAKIDALDTSVAGIDEDDVEDNYALENNFIQVKAGDRLANIPQHRFKFRLNYEHNEDLRFGLTTLAYGKAYMMGNENNKHQGDGETPGYVLLNADMNWTPAKNWLVSLKAINLLDKNYYSGGRLLMNGFNPGSGIGARDSAFRGPGLLPGSPQAAWMTISYDFK